MRELLIFLIDDHSLFREGLSRLLEATPDFHIVGQCSTAAAAKSALSTTRADVVLLDYDLGVSRASTLLNELKNLQPATNILMVTAGMSDAATLQIMEAGASGVCLKQSNPDQLIEAIRQVANGQIWLDAEAMRSLIAAKSAREEQAEQMRPTPARARFCAASSTASPTKRSPGTLKPLRPLSKLSSRNCSIRPE